MLSFQPIKNWLFQKKCEDDYKEMVTSSSTVSTDVCFICGEEENETQKLEYLYVETDPIYGIMNRAIYHRDCVEHIVCNSENLPEEGREHLKQAVQIVQQWKKDELRAKEAQEELETQLLDSKLFLCKENK